MLVSLWTAAALAQDRLVWDFDTLLPPLTSPGVVVPSPWTGSNALRLRQEYGPEVGDVYTWVQLAAEGDGAFVVTHDGLSVVWDSDYSVWGSMSGQVTASAGQTWLYLGTHLDGPVGVTGLSPLCGASAALTLDSVGLVSVGDDPGYVWIDDVALSGAVCPVYADADGDGWCPTGQDLDGDGTCAADDERDAGGSDCDDLAASVHPGATELACNLVDDDCDPSTPDVADADGDGVDVCSDCDDADPERAPGLVELACTGADEDCDPSTPDQVDVDEDGVGACTDCDDAAATVYPGAPEIVADGVDQDCDGGDACWADADGDGFGGPSEVTSVDLACDGLGEAAVSGDCDDGRADVAPGQPERTCDGVDQDCDPTTLDQPDIDEDGVTACTDCDDLDGARFPGAEELAADGVDQDCDGLDRCYVDADGDGYGAEETALAADCADAGVAAVAGDCDDARAEVSPGAAEVCDGIDDDCDGVVDPACPDSGSTGDTGGPPGGPPSGPPDEPPGKGCGCDSGRAGALAGWIAAAVVAGRLGRARRRTPGRFPPCKGTPPAA